MVENCGNCAFGAKQWQHHSQVTHCQRHAPIVYIGTTGTRSRQIGTGPEYQTEEIKGPITAWPKVEANDFCGDWELTDARS